MPAGFPVQPARDKPPPDTLALPHPDWIQTELTVTGPAAAVLAFRRAAAGAGVVPWHHD